MAPWVGRSDFSPGLPLHYSCKSARVKKKSEAETSSISSAGVHISGFRTKSPCLLLVCGEIYVHSRNLVTFGVIKLRARWRDNPRAGEKFRRGHCGNAIEQRRNLLAADLLVAKKVAPG
jgi:hypothetical protein